MAKNNIHWGNVKRINIPNFRNGDIFFVVYNKEIVAIRLSDSFINMQGGSCWNYKITGVATPANGSKVLSGRVNIYANDDNTIEVTFRDNKEPFFTKVYDSVEDVRDGIISRKTIDLTSLPIYTKGILVGWVEVGGYDDYFYFKTWVISDNTPKIERKTTKTFLFYEDGIVLSYHWSPLIGVGSVGYETEDEARKAIKARVCRYNVCTFEENEPKEMVFTIKVRTNMSALDILGLIEKELRK